MPLSTDTVSIFLLNIAALETFPIVMVGDYDSSKPFDESVQLRLVGYVARLGDWVGLGVLTEPVTLNGFVPATLSGQVEAPLEGDNLTFVGYSGDLLPFGVRPEWTETGWPGPVLEAPMWNFDYDYCSFLLGRYDFLCARPLSYIDGTSDPAFPCAGTVNAGPSREALSPSSPPRGSRRLSSSLPASPALLQTTSEVPSSTEATTCWGSRISLQGAT